MFDWLALPWIDALLPGLPSWAGWLGFIAAILAGIGLALALALLIAPVTAAIAGLFLDDVAEAVERTDYPADPPGRALPVWPALIQSLKFFGVVIAGNIVALLLLLIPGVNIAAFFVVNGYLLGREFFEFAAMRHRSEADAKALRRRHAGTIFLAGTADRRLHLGAAPQLARAAVCGGDDGASAQDDRGQRSGIVGSSHGNAAGGLRDQPRQAMFM